MVCDKDDVPLLVQHLHYMPGDMTIMVTFFNGLVKVFCTEFVCPSVDIIQFNMTRMQFLEAENNLNILATRDWKSWNHPTLSI